MAEQFQYLFTPLQIGPVTVRNRIVSPPHGTSLGRAGLPTEELACYHAERAKGGAGLIELEVCMAVPEPPVPMFMGMLRAWDKQAIPGFRRIAELIHEHGAKVFCEIAHLGVWTGRGPSAVPDLWMRATAREAPVDQIEEWVRWYGVTAANLREAGIDGIEIHASHGVGIQQFISPLYNRRNDKYGGALEQRLTFLLEVLDAVRAAIGNDLAVGVRLDGDELMPGGITLEDCQQIAQILEATGRVDYLSVDTSLEPHQGHLMCAPMYAPSGYMVYAAAAIKEVVEHMPVLTAGRIIDPVHAERILADGQADLIGMTRAQIADPQFANKARAGRLDDIRSCLGDNENCIGRRMMGFGLGCTVNPAIGRERELGEGTLVPAAAKKKVLVVGGGVAGMEAARIAAERGHRVTLCEQAGVLGGQVNLAAKLPGREQIGGIVRWQQGQLAKLGVEVRTGVAVTAEQVREFAPDAVVVATGAEHYRDGLSAQTLAPVPGWEQEHVLTPEDILTGRRETGDRVVIVDETGFIIGPGLAELLVDQGRTVELLTSDSQVGQYLAPNMQQPWVYGRIMSRVTLTPHVRVTAIDGSTVTTVNVHTHEERLIEEVDTVVLVTAKQPNDGLYRALSGQIAELHLIGDGDRATNAVFGIGDALKAGHAVGRQL